MPSARWSFINRTHLLNGERLPEFDPSLEEDRQMAGRLWPRLRSLIWVAEKRPSAFAATLFQFAKKQRTKSGSLPESLPLEGWSLLALVPLTDQLRVPLGADWDPLAVPNTWPRVLFAAVDDAVEIMWLLRAGMTIPAALSARALLERWTHNVAHHYEIDRSERESDTAYISRVWQVYATSGAPANVGAWWGTLSEFAHARQTAGRLGSRIVGEVDADVEHNLEIHRGICEVVELCLRQVRGGLSLIVVEAGQPQYVPALQARPPRPSSSLEALDLMEAYEDLDYYEAHRVLGERWTQLASIYREEVKKPARGLTERFDPVLTFECLLERRGRAIERARAAFSEEKETLGDQFDPGFLAARLFRYACFAELARLLAREDGGAERAAMIAVAQCLDAAVHAWLEDTDHSMAYLRVVLEQTARLRAHRLKPVRAARMEERGDASASRWLEEAGWRRLGVLMRAVNEFAHLGPQTRRRGARLALLRIQLNDPTHETSRGSALDSVAYLLAFELNDRLRVFSELAASLFTESIALVGESAHLERLERYLENAQRHRTFDFGDPDFSSTED
jgi:hypothetical protein